MAVLAKQDRCSVFLYSSIGKQDKEKHLTDVARDRLKDNSRFPRPITVIDVSEDTQCS